jgi:hypothetical protein
MLALKKILSRLTLKPALFSVALVMYLTAHQYWFRTRHRNIFSSIKFGSGFVGFTEYNYYLHGFLTSFTTYCSHLVVMLMMPWCITTTIKREGGGSNKEIEKKSLYSKRELLFTTLFVSMVLTILTWYVGTIQRNDLLFPERVGPMCLIYFCHTCFFLFYIGVYLLFSGSSPQPKPHLI